MYEFFQGVGNFFSTIWSWFSSLFSYISWVCDYVPRNFNSLGNILPSAVIGLMIAFLIILIITKVVGK